MKRGPCIVVWDDEQGLCCPMGRDKDCEGALESIGTGGEVVVFPGPKEARKAIAISTAYARLCKLQGYSHAVNEDFLSAREHLKILQTTEWNAKKKGN